MSDILENPVTLSLIGGFSSAIITIVLVYLGASVSGWPKIPERVKDLEDEAKKLKDMPERVGGLEIRVENIEKKVTDIYNALFLKSLVSSKSPKEITDTGRDLLKKVGMDSFLNDCSLVKDAENYKDKEGLDIFLSSLDWLDKDERGKRKVAEIRYESNASEQECRDLLAIAIRDEILKRLKS